MKTWLTLLVIWLASATAAAQDAYDRDPAECAQMSTDEVEVVPYVVQRGDSCARIARRQYGDRSRYDLIHAYNPGMGPEPHRHAEGTHLCLPRVAPPRGSGPAARVTALRPDVRSRPTANEQWQPTSHGDPVDRGTRVNTLTEAFAELTFRDTTVVTLRGDTLVVVYGASSGAVRNAATEAVLERGTLRSRLGALRAGHRLEVRTPASQVALNGGSAVTSVDAESTTRVSNHEGGPAQVSDASGRRPVRVAAGMGSAVRRGQAPSRPRPLPPAPAFAASSPRMFVGVPELTTVHGSWEAVPNARVYRVEISRRPDGRELVAQVEVPSDVTSFEVHRLPPGRYYVRLATIDRDFFESRVSDPLTIDVSLGGFMAPGEEAPSEEQTFDPGDPSAEVTAPVVAPGTRFHAPEGVECSTDGEAWQNPLAFDEPGDATLRCRRGEEPVGVMAVRVQAPDAPEPAAVEPPVSQATAEPEPPVEQPPEPAPEPEADSPRIPLWAQTFGTTLLPSVVGIREAARPHVGAWFGLGIFEEATPAVGDRVRLTGGARAGLFEGQLQLEAAVQGDVSGGVERTAQRGSGDLWGALGWAPSLGDAPVDVTFEVGAFFPTQASDAGLGVVRMVPSAHVAWNISDELLIRTRQGAFVDLDESGNVAWVSAYAFDARLLEYLSVGVEVDLSVGQEDDDLLLLPLAGPQLSLTLGPALLSLGARIGLTEEAHATYGVYSVHTTLEIGLWNEL